MKLESHLEKIKKSILSQNLSETTCKTYLFNIKRFLTQYSEKYNVCNPKKIPIKHVQQYLDKYYEGDRNDSCKRAMYSSVVNLYKILDVDVKFTTPKHTQNTSEHTYNVLSKEEILKYSSDYDNESYKLIYLLIYSTGLTPENIRNIKVKDVNLRKKTIRINDKLDSIFPKSLKESIKKTIKYKDPDEYMFTSRLNGRYTARSIDWIVKKGFIKKKQTKVHNASMLKASCIVHLLQQGASESAIVDKLGLVSSTFVSKLSKKHIKCKNIELL